TPPPVPAPGYQRAARGLPSRCRIQSCENPYTSCNALITSDRPPLTAGEGGTALSITDASFRPAAVANATTRSLDAIVPAARRRRMAAKGAAEDGSTHIPSRVPRVTTQRASSSSVTATAVPPLPRSACSVCTVPWLAPIDVAIDGALR